MKVWTKVFLCYCFSLGYIYSNPILKRTFNVEDEEYTKHIVEKIDNIKSITKDIDENRANSPQAAEEDKSAEDDTVPTAGEQQNESLTMDQANAVTPSPAVAHYDERRIYHSDSLKPLIRQLLPPNTSVPTTVQTSTSSLPVLESAGNDKNEEKDKNSEKDKPLPKAGVSEEKEDWGKYSKEEVQPTKPEINMPPGDSSPTETVPTEQEDVKETVDKVKQEENLKEAENPEKLGELDSPTQATISFEAKDDSKTLKNADTGTAPSTESTKDIQAEKSEPVSKESEMRDIEVKDISQPTPEPTQEQETPKVEDLTTTTSAASTTESQATESTATTTPTAFLVTNPPYPGMEEEIQDYGDEEHVSLWHKIMLGIRCARQDCRDALVPTPANLKRIMNKWSVTRKAKRVMSAPLNETAPNETLAETIERLKQNCNCKT